MDIIIDFVFYVSYYAVGRLIFGKDFDPDNLRKGKKFLLVGITIGLAIALTFLIIWAVVYISETV